MTLAEEYELLHTDCLLGLVEPLEYYLLEALKGVPRVDRVSVRAKAPDRFLEKANKTLEDGSKKYADPINEIQDQLGARIAVFYLFDVPAAKDAVLKYLRPIELTVMEPSGDSEFGYFGEHFILRVPDDIRPDNAPDNCPEFFELQIKTLFQHAWAEADHDLAYKSLRDLSRDEKRQIAFTAAQSWGADQIFRDLAQKLVLGQDKDPKADN